MKLVSRTLAALILLSMTLPAMLAGAQPSEPEEQVALQLVMDGLDGPLFVTHAGDERLFVLEKAGVIRTIENGELLAEPFLDISDLVEDADFEQGILGLAFHPDYASNGRFYVSYSPEPTGRQFILASYQRSDDNPNLADPNSASILLDIYHEGTNHYGGMLAFGPNDGYLYVSTGDGGGAYDPLDNAQDLNTLLGAILRLDVDGGDPYAIPADNPFVGDDDARDEIWAYGLRNPWRFSFDHVTGDMFIGDVGQETWEEINVYPADSPGGKNFGWPETEGFGCTVIERVVNDCDLDLYEPPAVVVENSAGVACSITGGYVYRGDPSSPLYGRYLYGDFCSGIIWAMQSNGDQNWQNEVLLDTTVNISSFGEDVYGELYVTDLSSGSIYKVVVQNYDPQPIITGLSPAAIPAGSESCLLTVNGFNLRPESRVQWNGTDRETTRSGSTSLAIRVNSEDLAQPGSAEITVVTPGADIEVSEPLELQITDGQIAGGAIANTWARTDYPVQEGMLSRTWMWGPQGLFCATAEPYADTPNGMRTVQYFDKARMEVNDPHADPSSVWYVTNGLLVQEMISGELQLGDTLFETREPSDLNVAGDLDDANGPTYATFSALLDRAPLEVGTTIIQKIDRTGNVHDNGEMAQYDVQAVETAPNTGHVVAEPFWEFMNSEAPVWENGELTNGQLFENPYYATGLPISEAYWTSVRVAGTEQFVLVQAFERRILTYTPANPEGWRVELGNVGLHYYFWRYDEYPYPEAYE